MKKAFLLSLLCIETVFVANAQIKPGGVSGSVLWLRADKGVTINADNKLTSPYWEDLSKARNRTFPKRRRRLRIIDTKKQHRQFQPNSSFQWENCIKRIRK